MCNPPTVTQLFGRIRLYFSTGYKTHCDRLFERHEEVTEKLEEELQEITQTLQKQSNRAKK